MSGMTDVREVFDIDSAWNARREKLESALLKAAEELLEHSGACGFTLPGDGFEVSLRGTTFEGLKS